MNLVGYVTFTPVLLTIMALLAAAIIGGTIGIIRIGRCRS